MKNRYECFNFSKEEINNSILIFFTVDTLLSKLVELTKIKLYEIIEKLIYLNLLEIPAASLLIIYDAEYFEKLENESCFNPSGYSGFYNSLNLNDKVKIKIVDFSFYKFEQKEYEYGINSNEIQNKQSITDKKMIRAIHNFISIINKF